MAHTPAPWTVIGSSVYGNNNRALLPANGADAALIAAAPELLAALQAMLNYANLGAYERADAVKAARAAVAKAGGAA